MPYARDSVPFRRGFTLRRGYTSLILRRPGSIAAATLSLKRRSGRDRPRTSENPARGTPVARSTAKLGLMRISRPRFK